MSITARNLLWPAASRGPAPEAPEALEALEAYRRRLAERCRSVLGTPVFPRLAGAMTAQGDPISITRIHLLGQGGGAQFPPWKVRAQAARPRSRESTDDHDARWPGQ